MKWLYNNWYKSTLIMAIFVLIVLLCFIWRTDMALFLIGLQFVVYLLHQFEEYILPGGFISFFNTKVLSSTQEDYPLNKKISFWINIPIIFIAYPLSIVLAGSFAISIGIWTAYFSMINALSHVGMSFKFGYNPGLLISIFLNIPFGLYTIYYFSTKNIISTNEQLIGASIGLLIQGGIMAFGFLILKPKAS